MAACGDGVCHSFLTPFGGLDHTPPGLSQIWGICTSFRRHSFFEIDVWKAQRRMRRRSVFLFFVTILCYSLTQKYFNRRREHVQTSARAIIHPTRLTYPGTYDAIAAMRQDALRTYSTGMECMPLKQFYRMPMTNLINTGTIGTTPTSVRCGKLKRMNAIRMKSVGLTVVSKLARRLQLFGIPIAGQYKVNGSPKGGTMAIVRELVRSVTSILSLNVLAR